MIRGSFGGGGGGVGPPRISDPRLDLPTSLTLLLPVPDATARKRVHKVVHDALRANHICNCP